jgi:aspartate carbamoyltransferase regulatory subunit
MRVEGISIEPIRNGTVIDHIRAGKALTVVKFLKIPEGANMGIVINVPSQKFERKDVIFVENLEMTEQEIAKVALISRTATLNIIRGGRVITKRKLTPPEHIEGIIRCPNPNCISNHERIESRFMLKRESRGGAYIATCYYCEVVLNENEIDSRIA